MPYFPANSVLCAVVDPGVGSTRRAVAVELGDWRFVLPDNGFLTHLLDRCSARRVMTLTNRRYQLPQPSSTFHGRDIFAPAAAHLAAGVPLDELGAPLPSDALCRLDLPTTRHNGNRIVAQIMHIDHFGTIRHEELENHLNWRVQIAENNLLSFSLAGPLPMSRSAKGRLTSVAMAFSNWLYEMVTRLKHGLYRAWA